MFVANTFPLNRNHFLDRCKQCFEIVVGLADTSELKMHIEHLKHCKIRIHYERMIHGLKDCEKLTQTDITSNWHSLKNTWECVLSEISKGMFMFVFDAMVMFVFPLLLLFRSFMRV